MNSTNPNDAGGGLAAQAAPCGCRHCLQERKEGTTLAGVFVPAELTRMVVCAICGNKRCPHANSHLHACTDSNAPGQPGSAYA